MVAETDPPLAVGADPRVGPEAAELAQQLERLRAVAALPTTLRDLGVSQDALAALAADAATQWTGTCNPRPFGAEGARELYERAY